MAAPVDTNNAGEGGINDNTIRGWMVNNGISLMDDTYNKLQQNGFANMFVSFSSFRFTINLSSFFSSSF